jgi:hypothetical protein
VASILPPTIREKLQEDYGITDVWRLGRMERLWQRYKSCGLVRGGQAVSLHRDCENADRCWADREPPSGRGSTIHLPWIGADYERASPRVLVVAMNLRIGDQETDPFVQLDIITNQVLPRFRFGAQRGNPAFHAFHTPAWQAVSQIRVSPAVRSWVSDRDRILAVNASALLEAVKCPTHPQGPTQTMWARCPTFVGLREEVEILEPDVLLTLGAGIPAALAASGVPGKWKGDPFVAVNTAVGKRPVRAYCLHHPRRPDWHNLCLHPLEAMLSAMPPREIPSGETGYS